MRNFILLAELGGVLDDPLVVDLESVLGDAGVLQCGYAEDGGEGEEPQL